MFGGQDNNAAAPQGDGSTPQDDALSGVADLVGGTPAPAPDDNPDNNAPAPNASEPAHQDEPNHDMTARATPQASADEDELLAIKQQALQQLSPLVGQLDQTPEEKFRTTMMLIQASDNQALLKDAYEAAQAIDDEKIRAQALLDVINEINYFTQNKQES